MGEVAVAFIEGDYEALAEIVSNTLSVAVDAELVCRACVCGDRGFAFSPRECWGIRPDDTVLMWLKNRLGELGVFAGLEYRDGDDRAAVGRLNVGFVSLPETDQMLARLRNETPRRREPQVARSKISSTNAADITPINVVAHRVARPPAQP